MCVNALMWIFNVFFIYIYFEEISNTQIYWMCIKPSMCICKYVMYVFDSILALKAISFNRKFLSKHSYLSFCLCCMCVCVMHVDSFCFLKIKYLYLFTKIRFSFIFFSILYFCSIRKKKLQFTHSLSLKTMCWNVWEGKKLMKPVHLYRIFFAYNQNECWRNDWDELCFLFLLTDVEIPKYQIQFFFLCWSKSDEICPFWFSTRKIDIEKFNFVQRKKNFFSFCSSLFVLFFILSKYWINLIFLLFFFRPKCRLWNDENKQRI